MRAADTDSGVEELTYADLAEKLDGMDRISAEIEEDKTFSPNLFVRAREGYGAPTQALRVLVRHFDDWELATSPTVTRQGDRAVMFRAKWGGF